MARWTLKFHSDAEFQNILCRYELEQLQPTIKQLATILASAPQAKLATVYQKYSNKKFQKIAR